MADEQVVKTALVEKEGKTRGKNPRPIKFNILNQIPKDMPEFMEVTGVKSQSELVELLYEGFNSSQYAAASDEIGEFINDAWDKETQNQFRLAVRNHSKLTGDSIEDVANMLRPSVDKAFAKRQAEAAAAKTAEANKPAETVTA